MLDWIRNPRKTINNVSIHWKALVQAFPRIGKWLAWKVEKVEQVRIVADPWTGCKELFRLTDGLIEIIQEKALFTLYQIVDPATTNIWQQGWKSSQRLVFEGDNANLWKPFVDSLNRSQVHLRKEDVIVWSKNPALGE